MAPTVCSGKKVRVASMKEARRRATMSAAQANALGAATVSAAGVIPHNSALSYVVKGSMNSPGRNQRRRHSRLPYRLQQMSRNVTTTTSPASSAEEIATKQMEQMELGERNLQISRVHSSSMSIGIGNSNSNIIKTVLQPTMANSNSGVSSSSCRINCNNCNNSKLCDQISSAEDDMHDDYEEEVEEDQGDGDSGYEFAVEPIPRHSHSYLQLQQQQQLQQALQQQQPQYLTHNEGLLSIAIKTIKLVQRNKLLQTRLAQLQLETTEFIASVLANPENRHFREKITGKSEASSNKVSNVLLRH